MFMLRSTQYSVLSTQYSVLGSRYALRGCIANTVVKLPQLGESVSEGTIGRWLKQPGDRVERDEPLVEIQTDKVNAEVPSPVAGILQQILLPAGTTAPVKTDMAIIGDETPASPNPPVVAER